MVLARLVLAVNALGLSLETLPAGLELVWLPEEVAI